MIALNRRRYMGGGDKYLKFVDPEVWRICCLAWGNYYQYEITDNGNDTVKIVTKFISKSYKTMVINQTISIRNNVDNSQGTHTAGTFNEPIGITLKQIQSVQHLYNINGYDTKFSNNTTIVHFPELQYFTGLTKIDDRSFKGCTNLEDIIIPANVTSYGDNCFEDCTKLDSIQVNGTVTSIGIRAFSRCSSLKTFTIQEGTTNLLYSTFSFCISLESVSIPSTLTRIQNYVFGSCSSLRTIIMLPTTPPTMTYTGSNFWIAGAPSDVKCYVPDNSLEDYKTANIWSTMATKIYPLSELPT